MAINPDLWARSPSVSSMDHPRCPPTSTCPVRSGPGQALARAPAEKERRFSPLHFLHRIIWGDLRKQRTLDEFVPLKFGYLREIIPDRIIKPLKDALLESGVIETDGQYIEGAKALGYRLSPDASWTHLVRVALSDPQTAAKIENSRKTENKTIKLDVHRHLRKQFKRLDVDVSRA